MHVCVCVCVPFIKQPEPYIKQSVSLVCYIHMTAHWDECRHQNCMQECTVCSYMLLLSFTFVNHADIHMCPHAYVKFKLSCTVFRFLEVSAENAKKVIKNSITKAQSVNFLL